jgi:hypothetical protein
VAVILDEATAKSCKEYWAVSTRVLMVKIQARPFNINIIQVYAPTEEHSEEEIEQFYVDLNSAIKACKSQEIKIVMGDLNAKVGKGASGYAVGPNGLGERNERGDRWVEWCEENKLMITNTWFHNHPRRLWTWKSPGDRARNQIDYIAISQRFRNAVKQAKGYPGADCGSDHIPIIAHLEIKLKRLGKKIQHKKYDWKELETNERRGEEYRNVLAREMKAMEQTEDINTKWRIYKEALNKAAEEKVLKIQIKAKQQWMNQEILNHMEERRLSKTTDTEKYKKLNKQIKEECKKAKEEWLNTQCSKIEKYKGTENIHEKIRELSGRKRRSTGSNCINNKEGKILVEEEDIVKRWEEYIEKLYEDERPEKPIIINSEGPRIMKEEVASALKGMKRKKAAGADNIVSEMILAAGEEGIARTTELLNLIYEKGSIPEDMGRSIVIPIPKKQNAKECEEHRTISLISHVEKILLKILLKRSKDKLRHKASEEQYGFKEDCGCRNAIYILRRLSERCIEMQKDIYICFIDYEKAFDNVKHKELFEGIDRAGVDGKDQRIYAEIYWNQWAAVRIKDKLGKWIRILKGARQGCGLSPEFFNTYGEEIIENMKELEGIEVGGRNINNLRFADDAAIMSSSQKTLQELLDQVVRDGERKGLKINQKKTVCMVISKKKETPICNVYINGHQIKQVKEFKYLGSWMTSDGKSEKDIKARIGMAKTAYAELKHILTNRHIAMNTRIRVLEGYIWPVMLYGAETWTISKVMRRKLEAAEMWFIRRMRKISWTEKKTNEEVLKTSNTKRKLMQTIRKRQLEFFGHIMRKEGLENLVTTGKIEGRRARGRQRQTYTGSLAEEVGKEMTVEELIHNTRERERWKSIVANVAIQGT